MEFGADLDKCAGHPMKNDWPCAYITHQMTLFGYENTIVMLIHRLIDETNQAEWEASGFCLFTFNPLGEILSSGLLDAMHQKGHDFTHRIGFSRLGEGVRSGPVRFQSDRSDCQTTGLSLSFQRPFENHTQILYILNICVARGHISLAHISLQTHCQQPWHPIN